ncbi:Glutathione S-transferase-like protein [Hapsidospora chrysogenum ATCC 11550]|uniref:Glutathione S-transferase-like protein n=1 Tax=Hapsidospora chrysogenum (strain ATCC 11550 / CBS 779.69 / DSM 880 / IAM 14645 / JCM 23072 / IMI 49137) TaxID=857340 RepID=A0A086T0A9_HAPC1|nr:Glutathione S-transferase-like protein [Hapsidospora chrysogenum ATCC 11550]
MPDITLYRANGSCSLVAHILLRELGIPFKGVVLDYSFKERRITGSQDGSLTREDYLKISPLGYSPALTVDGDIILENPAILPYIASLAPERGLAGKDPLDRARVAQWLAFLSGTLHGHAYGMFFSPDRFTDDEALFDAIRQKGRDKIAQYNALIERMLGGREFPVGDAETLADYYLYLFYRWGVERGFDMSPHKSFERIARRVEEKESVKETVKAEGKELVFGGTRGE